MIVRLKFALAVCADGVLESVTCTLSVKVFAVVGVPLNIPAELNVKPGTLPLVIDHEYGVVPPLAAKFVL